MSIKELLTEHAGHLVVIVSHPDSEMTLECNYCREVVYDSTAA
jgi:hypothetical protein